MARTLLKTLLCLAVVPALAGVAAAQDVVVKRFTGGSGVNAVGIVDAREDRRYRRAAGADRGR